MEKKRKMKEGRKKEGKKSLRDIIYACKLCYKFPHTNLSIAVFSLIPLIPNVLKSKIIIAVTIVLFILGH